MRIAVFSTKAYDRESLASHPAARAHDLVFLEPRLTPETVALAHGFPAICAFVNDVLDATVLEALAQGGTRLVALRCTGFNHVDAAAAAAHGIAVTRVSTYSPHAVAEFAVGTLQTLNRRIHRAYVRTRDNNFSLEGLQGADLHRKTVGVVGTGKIGAIFARIMRLGFGCQVLAHDRYRDPALEAIGVRYVTPAELVAECHAVSLHCPLTPETRHIVDARAIAAARPGVLLVNTGRGALVDTEALIDGLKSGQVGGAALDVYEQEADFFYEDLSAEIIADDVLQRLLTFPNVLVTSHQAFLTHEALADIAASVLASLGAFEAGAALHERIPAPPGTRG
jgi:D-lactate dehydrogenase